MAKATFEHTLAMYAPADAIRSALSQYEFFLEHAIHRNLARVNFLGECVGPDGITRRYYRNSERVQPATQREPRRSHRCFPFCAHLALNGSNEPDHAIDSTLDSRASTFVP
ncbi:MAG TPA: hypothetical protein VF510_22325 [Ktedonobacterales bacterium]